MISPSSGDGFSGDDNPNSVDAFLKNPVKDNIGDAIHGESLPSLDTRGHNCYMISQGIMADSIICDKKENRLISYS